MRQTINEVAAMASFAFSAFSAIVEVWGCPHVRWLRFIPVTLLAIGIIFAFTALWQSRWFPSSRFKEVANQQFQNRDVLLDGYRYTNCVFTNVTFRYAGRECGGFDGDCKFSGIGFIASDPAVGQMLEFLRELRLLREDAAVRYTPRLKGRV